MRETEKIVFFPENLIETETAVIPYPISGKSCAADLQKNRSDVYYLP